MRRSYQRAVTGLAISAGSTLCSVWVRAADAVPAAASATAASTITTSPSSPAGMLQVMVGLILVLSVLVVIAWGVKKIGIGKQVNGGAIRIVGGLHVGNRERIMVIEVANEWIVVGVTASTITALSTMPKQDGVASAQALPTAKNFSTWLQHTIEKRKAAATSAPTDSAHDA